MTNFVTWGVLVAFACMRQCLGHGADSGRSSGFDIQIYFDIRIYSFVISPLPFPPKPARITPLPAPPASSPLRPPLFWL